MQHIRLLFVPLMAVTLLLFSLQSCAPAETKEVSLKLNLASEGPYFSGGNSFMNDYSVDLTQLISEKSLTANEINSVKLKTASVHIPSGEAANFNQFVNASLQVVSSDLPMTTIAILNPIPDDQTNTIQLVVSESAELSDYFKAPGFTFLLDLDFKEDDYSDSMNFTIDLTLTVEHK